MKNVKLFYYLIITLLFVYVFVQFLSLSNSNIIYKFYTDYIMNKYCIIIYLSLLFYIMRYDTYTAVLLFILIIGPFKCSTKEYFIDNDMTLPNSITTTTMPNSITTNTMPNSITTTMPNTTISNLSSDQDEINKTVLDRLLGIDDRFKIDDIKKNEILREIKAQINFDPYKTELSKDVIYEIYNKYFDNSIFLKLQNTDEESKKYIASGNFNYIPQQKKVDFDIKKYQDLNKNNSSFGINSNLSKE